MRRDTATFSLLTGCILAALAAIIAPELQSTGQRVTVALFALGIFLMSSEAMRGSAYDLSHASRRSIFGLIHGITNGVYFCVIMMILLGIDPASGAAIGPWVAGAVFAALIVIWRPREVAEPAGLDLTRPRFGPGRWTGFTVVVLVLPLALLGSYQLAWADLGGRNTVFYFFLSGLSLHWLQRYPTKGGFWAPFALLRLFAMTCLVAGLLLPLWV